MLWRLFAVRNGLFTCSADGESEGRYRGELCEAAGIVAEVVMLLIEPWRHCRRFPQLPSAGV
jgi:hypothetical protein